MAPYPRNHFQSLLACVALLAGLTACSKYETNPYFPLSEGRWWYFKTIKTILDDVSEQRFIAANLGLGTVNSNIVYVQRQAAGREVRFRDTDLGIVRLSNSAASIEAKNEENWHIVLPKAIEVGVTWEIQTELTLIESRTFARQDKLRNRTLPLSLEMRIEALDEPLETPAGYFKHCLKITGHGTRNVRTDRGNASATVNVKHEEWYAPGIGLVKYSRTETSESPFLKRGEFQQILLSYE